MCETPSERVAVIVFALARAHGRGLTTRQAAELSGLTMQGAYTLLCRISRVLPMCQDGEEQWQLLDHDPAC